MTTVVTRIASASGRVPLDLSEIWRYRQLLWLLVRRDLRIRYRHTLIGIGWAIIQPVMAMVFFSLFFGRLGRLPSDDLPYPIFYYSALLPWTYFAHAVTSATGSLHEHARIIGRVYFPRLVLPLAPIFSGLVDLAASVTVLIALMAWYRLWPAMTAPAVVFFLCLAMMTASAVSLWLSALNARYRDVKYALGFGLQLWMLASPVVYPMTLVPEAWRPWYAVNPMAVVIQGFRWSLTGQGYPGHVAVLVTTAAVLALLVAGIAFFRRAEVDIADVI